MRLNQRSPDRITTFLAAAVFAILALLGYAATVKAGPVEHFLKMEGIEGESDDAKHKGEIDVLAWSWAETQPSAGEQGTAGKVSVDAFWFITRLSKASPKLMQACASGEHIKKAVLTTRKTGKDQQEYFKVTLSDIIISSYSTEAATTDDGVPTDRIGITFGKIEIEYREIKSDGTLGGVVKGGWDVKQNKLP